MPKFFKQNLLTPPHLLEEGESEKSDPIKTLFEWKAPSRPFRKKDRSYYTTVAILVVLTSLIAVLAGEFLLIGAILALMFIVYVLGFIPPGESEYKISNQGITLDDHFYHWKQLDSFWIQHKDGQDVLYVLSYLRFPAILMMVLNEGDSEKVKKTVAEFLPFHEIPPRSIVDKWSDYLQKHFPLESPKH